MEDINKYTKNGSDASNQIEFLNKDISILKENIETLNNKFNDFQIPNQNDNNNINTKNSNKNDDVVLLKKQMVQMEEDYNHIMMCVTQNRKQLEKKVDINYFKQELDSICNHSTIMENQNTINEIKNSLKKIQSDCSLLQPSSDHPSVNPYQNEVVNKNISSINNKWDKLNSQINTIKSALIANNILKINHETEDGLDAVPVMSVNLNPSQNNNNNYNNNNYNNELQGIDKDNKDVKKRVNRMENIVNYIMKIFNLTSEDISSNVIMNNSSPLLSYLLSKLKNEIQSEVEEKMKYLKSKLDTQINNSIQEVWNHLDENMMPVQQQMGSIKNILTEITKKISYFQYSIGDFNENDERFFENNIQLLLNNNNSSIKYYKDKIESQKYISLSDRINIIYDAIKQMIISNLYTNRGPKESLSNDSLFSSHNDSLHNVNTIPTNNNNNNGNGNDINNVNNEIIDDTLKKMLSSSIFKDKIISIIKETIKPKLLKIKNILHEKVNNDVLKELMKHLITREELKTELNHFSYTINDRFSKIGDNNENCHCANCIRKSHSCNFNDNSTMFNHHCNSNSNINEMFKYNDTQKIFNTYIKKLIEDESTHKNSIPNITPKSLNTFNTNNDEENLLKVYINLLIKNSLHLFNLRNNINSNNDPENSINKNNNLISSQNIQIEIEKLENSFDEKLFLLGN